MPAKQPKAKSPNVAASAPESGFWELRAEPFLHRWAPAIVVLVLLAGAGRIVATYPALSMTFDEPIHYTCGLEYLTNHAYRLETQHPPLERAMGALIPYLMGERSLPETKLAPKVPSRWLALDLSHKETHAHFPADPSIQTTVTRMRWGVLPFFVIGVLVVYEWARYLFGRAVGVLSAAIFTLIPTVLAHAGLATTDIALAACLGGAFLSLMRWAEAPTLKRAIVLGVWTAAAVLSKFTTLIYLPAAAVFSLAAFLIGHKRGMSAVTRGIQSHGRTFALAVAVGALLIWAGYWFSFGSVPWLSPNLRMPAPELVDGIKSVLEHNETGHRAFLFGQNSTQGWWYFFPVALAVKTPISLLLLVALGALAGRRKRDWKNLAPWAFAAGVLVPAMMGHINIGVRHVLPVFESMAIVGALGLVAIARAVRGPAALALPAVLLTWMVYSGVKQHPGYIAYFNEFAGDHPENILADSDLDWGQDLHIAARRLKELGAKEASAYIYGELFNSTFFEKAYGLPPLRPFQPQQPNPGWNLVSPTAVDLNNGGWHQPAEGTRFQGGLSVLNPPWWDSVPPTEKVGVMYLYNIPQGFVVR